MFVAPKRKAPEGASGEAKRPELTEPANHLVEAPSSNTWENLDCSQGANGGNDGGGVYSSGNGGEVHVLVLDGFRMIDTVVYKVDDRAESPGGKPKDQWETQTGHESLPDCVCIWLSEQGRERGRGGVFLSGHERIAGTGLGVFADNLKGGA